MPGHRDGSQRVNLPGHQRTPSSVLEATHPKRRAAPGVPLRFLLVVLHLRGVDQLAHPRGRDLRPSTHRADVTRRERSQRLLIKRVVCRERASPTECIHVCTRSRRTSSRSPNSLSKPHHQGVEGAFRRVGFLRRQHREHPGQEGRPGVWVGIAQVKRMSSVHEGSLAAVPQRTRGCRGKCPRDATPRRGPRRSPARTAAKRWDQSRTE